MLWELLEGTPFLLADSLVCSCEVWNCCSHLDTMSEESRVAQDKKGHRVETEEEAHFAKGKAERR